MTDTVEETLAKLEEQAGTDATDFEAERLHRKQRLACGLRTMGRLHLAEGVPGHVTVRDPEFPDRFWVNPFGKNFKLMKVSDLICVDHEGNIVEGDGALNAAAFAIHGQIHQARPDVIAAAHSHSMYGKTFSTLGKPLKMITQDATMFYNDVALCSDGSGAVVLDQEVGRKMAAALGDKKALIHQNHGLITAGGSVDAAVWWFIALERACQSQLIAEAAGHADRDPRGVLHRRPQGAGQRHRRLVPVPAVLGRARRPRARIPRLIRAAREPKCEPDSAISRSTADTSRTVSVAGSENALAVDRLQRIRWHDVDQGRAHPVGPVPRSCVECASRRCPTGRMRSARHSNASRRSPMRCGRREPHRARWATERRRTSGGSMTCPSASSPASENSLSSS